MAIGANGKRSIVLVCPAHEAPSLKELVLACLGPFASTLECRHLEPAELSQCPDLSASAAIVVGGSCSLPALPAELPVIAVGATPPEAPGLAAWIRRPSVTLFRSILHEALEGAPPSTPMVPKAPQLPTVFTPSSLPPSSSGGGRWRRKSDMIVGRSPAVRHLLDALDRMASSPAPVLVTGESGTGKELVARALHFSGPRAGAPFIALNCAAIPETLFEAELFGYVRGAFTGAVANRTGAFESAHRGTLFLDEIGEMPKTLQPKLLRVLERGELTRLGSNESRQVSVRVVTATNRRLEEEVKHGNFRQDLYYRLRVCHVDIAPLRERLEDLAPLTAHHLSIISTREGRPTVPRVSPDALEKLLAHRWPGNVRELVNVLEAAVLLARDNVIEADHLQLAPSAATDGDRPGASDGAILSYRDAKARFELSYYAGVLRAARGNVSLAAKLTQKTRKEIYDAIRRAGLAVEEYRDDLSPPR